MPHSVLSTHNAPLHGWSILFWGAEILGGDDAAGEGVKVCGGRAVEAAVTVPDEEGGHGSR